MTVLSTTRPSARSPRGGSRNHLIPLLLGGALAAGAVALVAYLLWPSWGAAQLSENPAQLPVSVGGTLFNVPTQAVRMKIQRHSGPQERIDLGFIYPSLEPPQAAGACQRRYRGTDARADRSDLPVNRGAS